jgi:hypothetical protein
MKRNILEFILSFFLVLTIQIHSEPSLTDQLITLDNKIVAVKNNIDSLELVIKVYLDDKYYSEDIEGKNEIIKDYEMEEHLYKRTLDTLISKKKSLFSNLYTDLTIPFYKLPDKNLDSLYFEGYYCPAPADPCSSLCIIPEKGIACNTGLGKTIYGFANLHNRSSKLQIDFEKFSRIGVYSMFPETYGSIEMIFAENRKIDEKDIFKRLVKQAHKYNTKVDLVLSYHDWDDTNLLKPRLDQGAVMLNMVDSVSSIIKK